MKKFYLGIFCILLSTVSFSQDPSFSQFYANRTYLNPAFTGLDNGVSVAAVSRLQWLAADRGFRTYGMSFEIKRPFINSGFGIQLFQDEEGIGELTNTSVGLSYSYSIPLRNHHEIKIGMQGRWVQKSIDWNKLIFSDQLDPVHGNIFSTTAQPGQEYVRHTDFDLGAIWVNTTDIKLGKRKLKNVRTNVGFSLHHLVSLFNENGGGESLQNLDTSVPPRVTIHAGSVIPLVYYAGRKKTISISPNFKYDIQGENLTDFKRNFQVVTYGAYLMFDGMYFGAMYQNKIPILGFKNTNALIFAAGAYIEKNKMNQYFIGFSYDANTSGLGTRAGGVYEVALRWTGLTILQPKHGKKRKRGKKKPANCYKFF